MLQPNAHNRERTRLTPDAREAVTARRPEIAGAYYAVQYAMYNTDPQLAREAENEDHRMLATAAMQQSLDMASVPETPVAQENLDLQGQEGVNNGMLDAMAAEIEPDEPRVPALNQQDDYDLAA